MGMNFTGQHRRTKHINLGGRSVGASSKDFVLKRAQAERDRREKFRKEEKAATLIQSFYRARKAVQISRSQIESEWMETFVSSSLLSSQLSSHQLSQCILQFNYFFPYSFNGSTANHTQVTTMLNIVKSNIDSFKSLKVEKSLIIKLIQSISSVLNLNSNIKSSPPSHKTKSNLKGKGKTRSTRKSFSSPGPIDADILYTLELLQDFSATGLLPVCSKYIESITAVEVSSSSSSCDSPTLYFQKNPQALIVRDSLTNIIFHQLEHDDPTNYSDFVSTFIATPGLHIFFDESHFQYKSNDLLTFISSHLSSDPTNTPNTHTSQYRLVWRLANFFHFFKSSANTDKFYLALDCILADIKIHIEPLKSSTSKSWKNIRTSTTGAESSALRKRHIENYYVEKLSQNPFIIKTFNSIMDRDFFIHTIDFLLNKPSLDNAGKDNIQLQNLSLFSSVISSLISIYPLKKQQVILFITLSPLSVIQLLWSNFKKSSLYVRSLEQPPSASTLREILVDDGRTTLNLLSLFLDLYSYWLIVANDSEFHGTTNSTHGLMKNEVESLAKFLRNFCFSILWNSAEITSIPELNRLLNGNSNTNYSDGTSGNSPGSYGSTIANTSVLVMRQIYNRDSRRRFLPNNFWLITDNLQMENFISAVVQEEEQVRLAAEAANSASDEEDDDDDDDEDDDEIDNVDNIADDIDGYESDVIGMDDEDMAYEEDEDDLEKQSYQQTKISEVNAKSLRGIAPRLEVLRQAPFFIPFDTRIKIFQELISQLRENDDNNSRTLFNIFDFDHRQPSLIRRDHLLEDAYKEFHMQQADFRKPISVRFSNEFGVEAGIGAGLTKEFLTVVSHKAFMPSSDNEYHYDTKEGLFTANREHLLFPNPILGVSARHSQMLPEEKQDALQYIGFLGKIIGKCIYEKILMDVEFAPFFLQKWASAGMGYRNSFDDLYSFDPELYNNLIKLYNYPGNVETDLMLDFTIDQEVGKGRQTTIELKPNGSNIPVTNANRLEYIHAVANYKLNIVLHKQTTLFLQGLESVFPLRWLTMFNAREIQMLISGKPAALDIHDLRQNSAFLNYEEDCPTLEYLWEVLEEMSEEDKRGFIKFVTSVPKAPLLGFSALSPKFAIRRAGDDDQRLPTSSTCVNLLKLPPYKTKDVLKQKLLSAIHADAGFELS